VINQKMDLPQETMVWYVVPALRRALVVQLKLLGLQQKDIAPLLGVTPSAISQYAKDKRASLGTNIVAKEPLSSELQKSALLISKAKDESVAIKEINRICELIRNKKIICEFHKINHPNSTCNICYN
jgi:predicted transcriptional regulator